MPQEARAQGQLYWYLWTQQAVYGANDAAKPRIKTMLNNAAAAANSYYAANKSLPRFDPDMDKFMANNYKSINGSVDGDPKPGSSGAQRSYGTLRMFYDARAGNLTKVNDKYELPSDWTGDINSVVLVTDGNSNAVAYFTGTDGKPAAFQVIDTTPDDNNANTGASSGPGAGSGSGQGSVSFPSAN